MSAAPKMLKIVGNFDQLEQEFKSGSDWNFLEENQSIENQRYAAVTNQTWNNIGSIRAIINSSQEAAYLIRKSRITDCGWNSEKTAAIMIIAKYLEIESGPLWENCREAGYCYSVSLTANIDAGTLTLELSDCSDLKKAFNAARQTINDVLNNELNNELFSAAQQKLIGELFNNESTVKSASRNAVLSSFQGVSTDFTNRNRRIEEYNRNYHQRNKEKIREYKRKYYQQHKENCKNIIENTV
uniref:Peptidase M16 C-terminal domain-containing protein n=1 Tax=Meloidogyne enterolobii TaxID=390850 RepID=A0A6V7ULX6_MELEN|nr:unnamed protein product [Meloidogyne enterolobii]